MRTTLTLDDDVARQLRQRAATRRGGFKQVVNETLRRGLASGEKPVARQPLFEIHAKHCGFRPGIDLLKLNQLLDSDDSARFIAAHAGGKAADA
ncbi:MAG: hypothetical protein RRC34_16290 [Lentisphaeria bacterium]|nr:hypothetical protein [Lentisphaeria bacterium]